MHRQLCSQSWREGSSPGTARKTVHLDSPAALYKDKGEKALLPLYLDGLYWASCLRFLPHPPPALLLKSLTKAEWAAGKSEPDNDLGDNNRGEENKGERLGWREDDREAVGGEGSVFRCFLQFSITHSYGEALYLPLRPAALGKGMLKRRCMGRYPVVSCARPIMYRDSSGSCFTWNMCVNACV